MRKKLSFFMVIVLSLLMSGCVISGTITDEFGTGIEGVEVMISGNEGNLTTQTDVDGNYAFGNLLPGDYTITPSTEAYAFPPATVKAIQATTTVDFEGETLSRFTDMGNGTVRDNDSGLIWLKDANAFSTANWDDAMTSAATLNSGEYGLTDGSSEGDWSLPTIEEWEALVDTTHYDPALTNAAGDGQWSEGDAFSNVQSYVYWSSTESGTGSAWVVTIVSGNAGWGNKGNNTDYYIWPVRSDN